MIESFVTEFQRYKAAGLKAIDQVPDESLNRRIDSDGNSIAVLVRHITGNLVSRFTDFLTADGEKPWRNRDSEFDNASCTHQDVHEMWARGFQVLEDQLSRLGDDDLDKYVYIRGQALTVHDALARSTAHLAYHVGQIVLLARAFAEGEWNWITIPKGKSTEYNRNPTKEKKPQ